MAEVLEKTGKTVEEAYQAALAELGLPESRVSYEVIEEPSKGFLGIIGGKLAKVRVTVRELSPLEKAENFLKEIFSSAKGADFLTDSYLQKILERRDQLLASKCSTT